MNSSAQDSLRISASRAVAAVASTALVAFASGVGAAEPVEPPIVTPRAETPQPVEPQPLLLVARPGLAPPFDRSVIVVGPMGSDRHLGVILNHPTGVTLDQVLPPSQNQAMPNRTLHLGGPELSNSLFAVVRAEAPPDASGIALSSDLFLVGEASTVDALIARDAPEARYFVGVVLWDSGELAAEMAQGLWSVAAIDSSELLRSMPDTAGAPTRPGI